MDVVLIACTLVALRPSISLWARDADPRLVVCYCLQGAHQRGVPGRGDVPTAAGARGHSPGQDLRLLVRAQANRLICLYWLTSLLFLCRFLSALAVSTFRPEALMPCFISKSFNKAGVYCINFQKNGRI